jgi:hypothetical protein
MPSVQTHLTETGAQSATGSPQELGALVREEWDRYGKVVRELGLKPE